MITSITKKFTFEAAHYLKNHQGKCRNMHGHSYKLFITATGKPSKEVDSPEYGMVVDFARLDEIYNNLYGHLDHSFLNEWFEYPTAEVIAKDILNHLRYATEDELFEVTKVVLYETEKCYAEVVAE